jgi:dUTP pyrophosphatase
MPEPKHIVIERLEDAPLAREPQKATEGSACFDVYAAEDTLLVEGKVTLVRTGLKMRAPPGTFIEIRPRSGLSTKGVIMANAPGTIDRDYALEVKVPLTVIFGDCYQVKAGDRIAQLRLVDEVQASFAWGRVLPSGNRDGGFGSTGK